MTKSCLLLTTKTCSKRPMMRLKTSTSLSSRMIKKTEKKLEKGRERIGSTSFSSTKLDKHNLLPWSIEFSAFCSTSGAGVLSFMYLHNNKGCDQGWNLGKSQPQEARHCRAPHSGFLPNNLKIEIPPSNLSISAVTRIWLFIKVKFTGVSSISTSISEERSQSRYAVNSRSEISPTLQLNWWSRNSKFLFDSASLLFPSENAMLLS